MTISERCVTVIRRRLYERKRHKGKMFKISDCSRRVRSRVRSRRACTTSLKLCFNVILQNSFELFMKDKSASKDAANLMRAPPCVRSLAYFTAHLYLTRRQSLHI